MNSLCCAGMCRAVKALPIESILYWEKKSPVSYEILIQVASFSILSFCIFKVISLKENIFSALGPPNTEQSCSGSLSACSLARLLESYFPFGLIIPSLEINCSGASIWQWEDPDLRAIVRAGFLQRTFRELSHSLPKSPPCLALPHHHRAFSRLNKSCPSALVSAVCFYSAFSKLAWGSAVLSGKNPSKPPSPLANKSKPTLLHPPAGGSKDGITAKGEGIPGTHRE